MHVLPATVLSVSPPSGGVSFQGFCRFGLDARCHRPAGGRCAVQVPAYRIQSWPQRLQRK